MLLGTLGASVLGNALTGKGVMTWNSVVGAARNVIIWMTWIKVFSTIYIL